MLIRPASAAHADAVSALLGEMEHPASPEEVRARLLRLRASGDEALVAMAVGSGVGLVTLHAAPLLHEEGELGRITALVVASSARGRGAGAALLQAAGAWARARGCIRLEVTSHCRRVRAHQFYERGGFVKSHVRMVKPL